VLLHGLELIRSVLSRHPSVTGAILFGSRAMRNARRSSDVDLALEGIDDPLEAESIARELDDLPIPYRFDVRPLASVRHPPLREHIARVGVQILGEAGRSSQ
jgi:predicted nucleotidyltransferase